MTGKINDGGPACAWCDRSAHIRQGRILLCEVHYRLSSMRSTAKRAGKEAPTVKEMESLIPSPLVCGGCHRPMNWLQSQGASTQATFQHDRDGTLKIVCLSCNTKHACHPGDSFWSVPEGHKRCASCDRVLGAAAFSRDRSRPCGLKSSCKECSHSQHTQWRTENRDYYNGKQRENRARRAAAN